MADFIIDGAVDAAVGAAKTPGVAGAAFAEAVTISPIEMMNQLSERWFTGATKPQRADMLRLLLKNGGASKNLMAKLEGDMAEKVLSMPPNKIPKTILNAAGGSRKQAQFTILLRELRQIKSTGPSKQFLARMFKTNMKAAKQAGFTAAQLDVLKRMGPERVFHHGSTSIARVYDIATQESKARKLLRWATRGSPHLEGKKFLGTGPSRNLVTEIRAQLDEIEGLAKSKLSDEVSAAKGVFGKTGAAIKGGASRVGEAINPKGFSAAEESIVGSLGKVGAKGLGKAAKLARGLGGMGTLLAVPLLGFEAYDSLVGKSKRARAMVEASRQGGTASVSQELMYDILDKRADLQARRAMLAQNPKLMQSIVQTLGGQSQSRLTTSEAGFGIDMGPQGTSPGDMNKMLDRLLSQMRGM